MASFVSKLNPIPSLSPYAGPYKVGTNEIEIAASELVAASSSTYVPVSTIQFRCFYPCEPPSTNRSEPVYWCQSPQRSIISAYCRFLGLGSSTSTIFSYLSQVLYHIQIPAHHNASLLPSPTSSRTWPVLIFSHGLGGSRNSYSQICGTLASYGIVVLAPEHRDGSCPISHVRFTKTTEAYAVDYKKLSHRPSAEVYRGRDEMLSIRLWEIALLHEALRKINAGCDFEDQDLATKKDSQPSATDCLKTFQNKLSIATPGSVIHAGHSFGSATVVQYLKSLYYHPSNEHYAASNPTQTPKPSELLSFKPSSQVLNQITSDSPAILLDLWTLPLNSPTQHINRFPMPCYSPHDSGHGINSQERHSSVLAVLSSAFVNWTSNFNDVKRILADPREGSKNADPAMIFYPLSSAHLSQSDFGLLFPRVTRYFAKAEEPERTLKLNARAILQMLRARNYEIAGEEDTKILSSIDGSVRGWVAVDPNSAKEQSGSFDEKDSPILEPEIDEARVVGDGELAGATHNGSTTKKN